MFRIDFVSLHLTLTMWDSRKLQLHFYAEVSPARSPGRDFRIVLVLTPFSILMSALTLAFAGFLAYCMFGRKENAIDVKENGVGRLPCTFFAISCRISRALMTEFSYGIQ